MARPNKIGLDYFPLDVDIFDDEKMVAISGEFGLKGEITVIKLLCTIYRNGYFILWNDLLKFKLLRNLPGISLELLESIVYRLVLWGFFDKALFDSVKVLTSKGIQTRYFEAARRRKIDGDLPYLLVNVDRNGVYVNNNSVNVDINTTKERKEKKIKKETPLTGSKEKPAPAAFSPNSPYADSHEISAAGAAGVKTDPPNPPDPGGEETPPPGSAPPPSPRIDYIAVMNDFNARFAGRLPSVSRMTDARRAAVRARIAECGPDSVTAVFDAIAASPFLCGQNDRNWRADFDWVFRPRNYVKILENNYKELRTNGQKIKRRFGDHDPADYIGQGVTDI